MPETSLIDFHGLPALRILAPDGAQAIVTLLGGHVASWIPAGGTEQLYLSERSAFEAGKAIRGGVPVIFPRFGTEPEAAQAPRHGFARLVPWTAGATRTGSDFALGTVRLESSAQTQGYWPGAFSLELTVCVAGSRLDMELEVTNSGADAYRFTAALHTYLNVAEVEDTRVEGLRGRQYRDQTAGGELRDERHDAVVVGDEVDRVYFDAPSSVLVRCGRRNVHVEQSGFSDLVVWNPWEAKCASLADMPANGFRHMLCTEAARVGNPIRLAPGEQWVGRQSLTALTLP